MLLSLRRFGPVAAIALDSERKVPVRALNEMRLIAHPYATSIGREMRGQTALNGAW